MPIYPGDAASGPAAFQGALVYRNTNQTIPASILTPLSFAAATINTGTMWVIGSPTRITIAITGKYHLRATCQWTAGGTGRRQNHLRIDGNNYIAQGEIDVSAAAYPSNDVSCIANLAAGQYVEAVVWQDSGGDLSVFSNGAMTPQLEAFLIGT